MFKKVWFIKLNPFLLLANTVAFLKDIVSLISFFIFDNFSNIIFLPPIFYY